MNGRRGDSTGGANIMKQAATLSVGADPRTEEPVFRPEWPVVDAHQHFWDGCLRGSGLQVEVPVYTPEDLLADMNRGHNVIATVAVESFAHYGEAGPPGETAFAHAAGRNHPRMANAIVGWADLRRGEDLVRLLNRHQAASSRLRGIRHSAAWDDDPAVSFATLAAYTARGMLHDPAFVAGVRELGRRGLVFDTFIVHPQLADIAVLADNAPDTPIVVNHIGMPLALGRYEADPQAVRDCWARGIAAIAERPNIWLKLGGTTMKTTLPGREASTVSSDALRESLRPWLDRAITIIGPARCLFESNFPVEKATCGYRLLWNAFKKIASDYSEDEAHAMLAGNALKLYRIASS